MARDIGSAAKQLDWLNEMERIEQEVFPDARPRSEVIVPDLSCVHEWEYDEEESKGPWTGYIERCKTCGALQQVPQ